MWAVVSISYSGMASREGKRGKCELERVAKCKQLTGLKKVLFPGGWRKRREAPRLAESLAEGLQVHPGDRFQIGVEFPHGKPLFSS
jgi:hypothetical protein